MGNKNEEVAVNTVSLELYIDKLYNLSINDPIIEKMKCAERFKTCKFIVAKRQLFYILY